MLQFPITTTKTEQTQNNGQTIIQNTFNPARWDFSTAAKIIETADRLQRLALELETSRAVVDATVEETDDIEMVRRKRWEAIAQQLGEALSEQDVT